MLNMSLEFQSCMNADKILVNVSDGVMTVTLNRPEKLNAIDNDLAEQLLGAIETASRHEDVRVMLLRGSGRAFCAGRDVGAPPTDRDLELVQAVSKALVAIPKPVMAAVHGWTVGAGFEWMLDADVAVAAISARFKLPEASLGVFVTGGLTATLAASVGLARAKSLMLFGDEFSAEQAFGWGLVSHLVPESGFDEAALSLAKRLAALDPRVSAQYKRVMNEIGLAAFDQAVEAENRAQMSLGAGA